MRNIAIIMCPPLSIYAKPPPDISACELVDCPHCNEKMWFSEKKKEWQKICEMKGKKIIFACHLCLHQMVEYNPKLILGSIEN